MVCNPTVRVIKKNKTVRVTQSVNPVRVTQKTVTARVCQTPQSIVRVTNRISSVRVKTNPDTVRIINKTSIIRIVSPSPKPLEIVPFYFIAIEGQTDFTLPSFPVTDGLFTTAINGTQQSQAKGDFSVSGNILTIDEPLEAGDEVFGIYEKT